MCASHSFDIMRICWTFDPAKRPTMEDVLGAFVSSVVPLIEDDECSLASRIPPEGRSQRLPQECHNATPGSDLWDGPHPSTPFLAAGSDEHQTAGTPRNRRHFMFHPEHEDCESGASYNEYDMPLSAAGSITGASPTLGVSARMPSGSLPGAGCDTSVCSGYHKPHDSLPRLRYSPPARVQHTDV